MQVFISITLKAFFDGRRDLLKGLESREGVDPSLRDGSPVAEAGANGKGQALSDRSYPSTPTTIKTRMETKIAGQPHRHPSSSSRFSSRGVSPLSLSTAPIQMPHPLGETGREICVYEYVYELRRQNRRESLSFVLVHVLVHPNLFLSGKFNCRFEDQYLELHREHCR